MHKRLLILPVLVLTLFLCAFSPSSGYWLDVQTTQLGNVRIYINYSYSSDYFALDESSGLPLNMSNSTLNGYILNSSGVRTYAVTIGSYGETWYYRSYNSSSQYNTPLTIISIDLDNTTVQFIGLDIPEQPDMMLYLLIFFAAAILLGVWRCARK